MDVKCFSFVDVSPSIKLDNRISPLLPKYFQNINKLFSLDNSKSSNYVKNNSKIRVFDADNLNIFFGGKTNIRRNKLWIRQNERKIKGTRNSKCINVFAKNDLEGETVAVVGLGKSGKSAAKLALARGAERVIGMDTNTSLSPLQEDPMFSGIENGRISTKLGPHRTDSFRNVSQIILSPGVPSSQPDIALAMKQGIKCVSELGFAAEALPKDTKIVAISGTNGKSTVTSFTGQILEKAGLNVFVGGNLGTPLSEGAFHCLKNPENSYQVAVVEVSSYQMELPGLFQPNVGVILNLSPDHQERHGSMEAYGEAKCRMFQYMDPADVAIIPHENSLLRNLAIKAEGRGTRGWIGGLPGVQLDSQGRRAIIVVPTTGQEARLFLSALKAVGKHNASNAAIASLLSLSLSLPPSLSNTLDEGLLQETIPTLEPLPHRMQIVKEERNIIYINDSKATNVDATLAALKGLIGRKAVVLLGGIAKKIAGSSDLGFGELVDALSHHRAVVTFGSSGEDIANELEKGGLKIRLDRKSTLVNAIEAATSHAISGDVILLSPGCASFDEFKNFEHRGRVFSETVNTSSF